MSVPNQLITKTKKTKPQKDFLLISNRDWIEASKNLSASGFLMYLWLIRHDESFNNELSKQAFMNEFDVSASTYDRAWKELRDKKYAVQREEGSNIYYIYTSPQTASTPKMTLENNTTSKLMSDNTKNDVDERQKWCQSTPKMNIEIDKQININNNKQNELNQQRDGLSAETAILMTKEEILKTYNPNALRKITPSAIGNTRFLINGTFIEMVIQ